MVKCLDCNATCESPEKAKNEHWGWSYGREGTIWVCPPCLERRENELQELT